MIIKITSDKNYKVFNDKKEWIRTFSKFDTYISETQGDNKDGVLKYFKNWSRMISDVFYSGFDLGQKISQGFFDDKRGEQYYNV